MALAPISVPVCVNWAEFQWEGGCEYIADGISSLRDKQEVVSIGYDFSLTWSKVTADEMMLVGGELLGEVGRVQ